MDRLAVLNQVVQSSQSFEVVFGENYIVFKPEFKKVTKDLKVGHLCFVFMEKPC